MPDEEKQESDYREEIANRVAPLQTRREQEEAIRAEVDILLKGWMNFIREDIEDEVRKVLQQTWRYAPPESDYISNFPFEPDDSKASSQHAKTSDTQPTQQEKEMPMDKQGQVRLVEAAKVGNVDTIRTLLDGAESFDAQEIQEAFEVAADAGLVEVATMLVDAGAEPQSNYDFAHGEGMRCPICYRRISVGALEVCEHFVCSGGDEETLFGFVRPEGDFAAEFEQVRDLLESLRYEVDDLDALIADAPMSEMLTNIAEGNFGYWADESVEWETGGMLSGAGYDYFSFDSRCAQTLKADGKEAIEWLQGISATEEDEEEDEGEEEE